MDLSNKSLALLLLAAIVVSLFGTILSLNKLSQLSMTTGPVATGRATASGKVNLTINTSVGCSVDRNVNFGTDSITTTTTISTDSANSGTNFNDCTTGNACVGMEINNTGNVNVNVTFQSDKAATTFLGGPSVVASDFQFKVVNGTQPSPAEPGCVSNGGSTGWGAFTNVGTSKVLICDLLNFSDSNDIINVEYQVTLRADTPPGTKTATITITCEQV